ncbi:MAG: LLM class F420-dependent oxidoreductase [Candidatus Dormibacteraceae bacterium]
MAAARPIRFGIFPSVGNVTWPELRDVWHAADELGYATAWIPDHFYSGGASIESPNLEAWTSIAALAACTQRIRFGTMVSGNTYRHPAVLANMAATVDQISDGRLVLGIGAGWMQVEHHGYGIPLPPPRERLDRLDEALRVIRLLFTERRANFEGRYYQLRDAVCEPKPIQKPYPPLLLGGGGEKRTLRVVARHADEWNGEVSPRGMARKIAILHEHCRAIGRNPDEIEVSVLLRSEADAAATYESMVRLGNLNLVSERQRLIEEGVSAADLDDRLRAAIYESFLPEDDARATDRLNEYVAAGVTHFVVIRRAPYDFKLIERFIDRVAPRVRG